LCVFTFIVLLTLFMPSVRYNSVVHWSWCTNLYYAVGTKLPLL
jgi:hypothetical protein